MAIDTQRVTNAIKQRLCFQLLQGNLEDVAEASYQAMAHNTPYQAVLLIPIQSRRIQRNGACPTELSPTRTLDTGRMPNNHGIDKSRVLPSYSLICSDC